MNISFLSISTQYENLGDALINRELIHLVSQHSKLHVDVSRCPDWFVEMLNLPADTRFSASRLALLPNILKARMKGQTPYYFLIPGGNFGEYSLPRFVKSLIGLSYLFAVRLAGARICQLGVSYERSGPRYMTTMKLRTLLMHALYVRDTQSSKLLEQYKVKHNGVLPDLAFNLFAADAKAKDKIGTVCFSFRTDQSNNQQMLANATVDSVIEAMPKSTRYVLSVQVERDMKAMKVIQKHLKDVHGIEAEIFHEARDITKIQNFYKTVDVVVSNRLHVLLLGSSACGRLVACVDDKNQKVTGLFKTLGRGDLVVPMKDVTADLMKTALAQKPFGGKTQHDELAKGVASMFA